MAQTLTTAIIEHLADAAATTGYLVIDTDVLLAMEKAAATPFRPATRAPKTAAQRAAAREISWTARIRTVEALSVGR